MINFCTAGAYADEGNAYVQIQPATGEAVASFAMSYLNSPYCWGGENPESGFDCSGFVKYVYSSFGIEMPRTTSDLARNGMGISFDSIKKGDIVVFFSGGSYSHCGIYVGDGQIIHAFNDAQGVVISGISDLSYDSMIIRRIL